MSPTPRDPSPDPENGGSTRQGTAASALYSRLVVDRECFWTSVHPLFMRRDITKETLREIVRRGLADAHGDYRAVVQLFNMEPGDYRRFLGFLRKYDCLISPREYL